MVSQPHICIVTSSDISTKGIGGDGRYSILLHMWMKSRNINSTLLGSFSFKIKIFESAFDYDKPVPKVNITKKKKTFIPYPFFMAKRFLISLILSVKVLRLHSKLPISLIHAQDTGYIGLAAVMVGKILKIPVVVSSHGIRHKTIDHALKSKMKGIIYRIERKIDLLTIKNASDVIVDNGSIRNYFENVVRKRIKCIPIPIEVDKFEYTSSNRSEVREQLRLAEDIKVIGFIGRFAPEKNLINLLTAFSNVLQNFYETKLLLVGTGPLESELKNFVNNKKMTDNVIFCGVRNDINKVLASCDIFILPSYVEGMSVALLEAMATGISIICSNIPSNAELISDRKEGILIDPHKPREIENAVIELLENSNLRVELSKNAKMKATQFDLNLVFPKLIQTYENQIGRSLL